MTSSISIESALPVLPFPVARKVQAIADENGVGECELLSARALSPQWDQVYLLPRNSRMWAYTGGFVWLLFSDGETYAEPAQVDLAQQESSLMGEAALWVITLDDAAEHLRVSRCLLIPAERASPKASTTSLNL